MTESWQVLKFGGSSVAQARHWATIAGLVAERRAAGHRLVLVCSALAGVTNALQQLVRPETSTGPAIEAILNRHAELAAELNLDASALLSEARQRLEARLERWQDQPGTEHIASILAMGEWMSSRLGHAFLALETATDWVDASDALEVVGEADMSSGRSWLSARVAPGPDQKLQKRWAAMAPVLVTQGFVARRPEGGLALLGRGGSDTSAALLAGRLQAPEVEIWTDVPGLFSADPAMEPEAMLLQELAYGEALEMAASGARVVHPRAIHAAADSQLTIIVRDLARPQLQGTRISGASGALQDHPPAQGIKAVTCQQGMLVMLLENLDMRQQVGFLANVFDVYTRHGISIDLVATSETTTTVAINRTDNPLDEAAVQALSDDLRLHCSLRVFDQCCCVNLVGQGARLALAELGPAARAFREWPLLMLSQSANDLCLSLLVYPDQAATLVHDLHRSLVCGGELMQQGRVFGPSWQSLTASD